jgi:6-phosphogluconate dehydrogenase
MNEPQMIASGKYCLLEKSETGFDVTIYRCPIEISRRVIRSASVWGNPVSVEMYDKLIESLKKDREILISDFEIGEKLNHKEGNEK